MDEIFNASNKSSLAFAKNGAPMVADKNSTGYVSSYIDGIGEKINVKNDGGPLMAVMPGAKSLSRVTSITINLQPDKYAHIESPYKELGSNTLVVEGPGTKLSNPKTFKISELEGKQNLVITGDYNIKKAASESQIRYRGIDLYSFLRSVDVGLQSNASEVVFTASDGKTQTFSLADVMKSDYLNGATKAVNLKMILAYGSSPITHSNLENGKPLVLTKESEGYDPLYNNSGGPLYLIVGQKSADDTNSSWILKNVVKITVKASAATSWKHDMSPTYSQCLDTAVLELEGTALEKPVKFTLRQLEAMDDIILRDSYTYIGEHQHEGLDIWKLITQKAGLKTGAELTSVKVAASDGFSRDVLSVFGKDALEKGIADGLDRKIIMLSYAADGNPLVTDTNSDGYTSGNDGGPIRMITHLNQGACLKNVVKIVVDGNASGTPSAPAAKVFTAYLSGDKNGLPMAGVRIVIPDDKDGLWIGTYGGGAAYLDNSGKINAITLPGSYVNDIAIDKDGGVWFTLGGQEPQNQKGAAYLRDIEDDFFSLNSYGTKEYFHFRGVKMKAILDKVGLNRNTATVSFIASDGYKQELTLEQALREDYIDEQNPDKKYPVIIAWHENGEDYNAEKGAPFRLVIGQKESGDVNKPLWVQNLAKIIVD